MGRNGGVGTVMDRKGEVGAGQRGGRAGVIVMGRVGVGVGGVVEGVRCAG